MDLGLPDMTGYDVTKLIRKLEGHVNKKSFIIALSAHIDKDIESLCYSSGMDAIFTKPLLRKQAKKIIDIRKQCK